MSEQRFITRESKVLQIAVTHGLLEFVGDLADSFPTSISPSIAHYYEISYPHTPPHFIALSTHDFIHTRPVAEIKYDGIAIPVLCQPSLMENHLWLGLFSGQS